MANPLKTYPVPWKGQIILACRKCQKKLRGDHGLQAMAKLKKTIRQHNKEHPHQLLHVINVGCMDLCPKEGVTVCGVRGQNQLRILRSQEDVEKLALAF